MNTGNTETPGATETPGNLKFKIHPKVFETILGTLKIEIGDEFANTTRFGIRCHDIVVKDIKTKVSKKHESTKRTLLVNGYALYWIYGRIPKGPYKYIFSTYKAIKYHGIADADVWLDTYIRYLTDSDYGKVLAGQSIRMLVKFAKIRIHECMLKDAIEIIQAGGNAYFVRYCIQYMHLAGVRGGIRTRHILELLSEDMQKRPQVYKSW